MGGDIARWLESLGLGHHAGTFADSAIDLDILPELAESDLEKLGIPLGDRKRLLKAVAGLAAPAPAAPAGAPGPARQRAERRQLTVVFCDLVGSTELSTQLDPEDLGQVMRAYQQCCARVIGHWNGHVARYLGDGVLAYFGFPRAHEYDAERAVRAGLDLVAAVARLPAGDGKALAARVGIATGTVVVGDLIGTGAAQEESVVGETPNLAARLQELAAPGTVVVAASTRRLVGGLFELSDLGAIRLKGFSQPLAAFRVVGEARVEGRFEALRGRQLTPLVGRAQELDLLLERWARAKRGQGQVVMISGEPGIGKSRIVRALRERLAGEAHVVLSHFCSPHHTNTPLHPIIAQIERAAGFAPDDAAAARLGKLEALIGQATSRVDEAVPLLAALLGVPGDGRHPPLNLTPERQKQRTLEVLIEQLTGLARSQPVLDVHEDAHWADPSTLEALALVVEQVRRLPILLVLTFRPEFTPPWPGGPHVSALHLNRLGRPQAAAMVARLAGDKALPAGVGEQILARTDGVPLFVEELTKTVLESGLLRDAGDRWELDGPLRPLSIPGSLHDSLMARLDRLGPAKTVAQIAAVLGHSFDTATMRRLWDGSEEAVRQGLDRLVEESLIIRWGLGSQAHYMFKHALIEEVAYESLLRQDRRKYHLRAAEILCAHAADLVRLRPEIVARHYAAAGQELPASDAWLEAGRAAIQRSANAEALAHLQSAEAALLNLERSAGKRFDGRWVALHMARAPVLIALSGWAAPEVEQAYRAALAISERAGAQSRDLFDVWRGLYNVYLLRGDLANARGVAARLHGIAVDSGEGDLLLGSHRAVGLCDFLAGEFGPASRHLAVAISLYDPVQHRHHAFVQGTDPAVIAYSIHAWALWFAGQLEAAASASAQAIQAAQRADHPFSLAYALCLAASLARCRGSAAEAAARCDAALGLAAEHAFPYWRAWASIVKGAALVELGERAAGFELLTEGLERYAATGAAQMRSYGLCLLAEASQRAGRWPESAAAAGAAVDEAERTGVKFYLAEAHRLSGAALCELDPGGRASARALLLAVRVAERQRSDMLLLRAGLTLLESSRRGRLRASIVARTTSALRRMQQGSKAPELELLQERLANATAEACEV